MRIEKHLCDICGKEFEPKKGFGSIKLQRIDPSNPINENGTIKPNVESYRKDEMCSDCTDILFKAITYVNI